MCRHTSNDYDTLGLVQIALAIADLLGLLIVGVQTYTQVVVLRFFIGVFEAGFYPGLLPVRRLWCDVELTYIQA